MLSVRPMIKPDHALRATLDTPFKTETVLYHRIPTVEIRTVVTSQMEFVPNALEDSS